MEETKEIREPVKELVVEEKEATETEHEMDAEARDDLPEEQEVMSDEIESSRSNIWEQHQPAGRVSSKTIASMQPTQ